MPTRPRPSGLPNRIPSWAWKWLHWKTGEPIPVDTQPVRLPRLAQVPSPNYSTRSAPISLVVMHDTEGPYESAVNWFKSSASQVSAHIVLSEDGKEATQSVRYSKKAWACMAFNSQSLNLEMAGKASVGYQNDQIDAAAAIVAYWCKLYKIPIVYSDGSRPGITFHQDLGAAGGGHHDPGFSTSQKKQFVNRVLAASRRGVQPARWGRQ